MSIDYNEKFKELRKKISNISKINSEFSKNETFYKNKIKQLELNTEQRIDNISNKFTNLKDDFIKVNSNFSKNISYKSYNKNNSFYYPLIPKKEIDQQNLFVKNVSIQISEELSNNSKEMQNNIYLKFFEMENLLKRIFEKKREDRKILKKEIINLAGNFRENIENLNQKIENIRVIEENSLINISENFKRNIFKTNEEIKDLKKKNEKYDIIYKNKKKEMKEWITNNFEKEKRKREMFQENVMKILKETCNKLSEDFYKNNKSDEYDDNEMNEEEESNYNKCY